MDMVIHPRQSWMILLAWAAAAFTGSEGHAAPVRINDTGQTACYSGTTLEPGGPVPCDDRDWPGQDGAHGRDPAELDGGTGKAGSGIAAFDFGKVGAAGEVLPASASFAQGWRCTFDHVTGLLWQAGPTADLDRAAASAAVDAANSDRLCGHADWRLPGTAELQGLVHYGASGTPSADVDLLPGEGGFYWSGELQDGAARVVNFDHGYVHGVPADRRAALRLVRGARHFGGLVHHGDGTVTDPRTGLMWDACALGDHAGRGCEGRDELLHWRDALLQVELRNAAGWRGHGDWRLPNIKELASLLEHAREGRIGAPQFPNAKAAPHWSSTTAASAPFMAWALFFGPGSVFPKEKATLARVRLVRTGAAAEGPVPTPVRRARDPLALPDPAPPPARLPLVALTTDEGVPVDRHIYADGTLTITGHDTGHDYSGQIEIKGRGNSTWGMPKKPYRIKLADKAPLFGMPSSRHWVLLANHADRSLLRTELAMSLGESLNMAWTPRFQQVEVTLNGEYLGVYQFGEHVRVDPDRVNIVRMQAGDTGPEAITGGYLMEIDARLNCEPEVQVVTRRGTKICVEDPDEEVMVPEQHAYLGDFLDRLEDTLHGPGFADPATGYAAWLDPGSFIDWFLVNELTANVDAANFSSIKNHKDRNGRLIRGPLWDFDLSSGNAYYCACADPERFHVRNGLWYNRLFQDPVFAANVARRWESFKASRLDRIGHFIDARAAALGGAARANFERWSAAGEWIWPNSVITGSHDGEVEFLKDWLRRRIEWLDAQFAPQAMPPLAEGRPGSTRPPPEQRKTGGGRP